MLVCGGFAASDEDYPRNSCLKFSSSNDIWNNMQNQFNENEVQSAASLLREHCEFFYENVYDSLRGNVGYKSGGRWDLGDFLNGAKGSLKGCLKKSIKDT